MCVLASRVVSGFVCDTAWVHGFSHKGAWFSRRNRIMPYYYQIVIVVVDAFAC